VSLAFGKDTLNGDQAYGFGDTVPVSLKVLLVSRSGGKMLRAVIKPTLMFPSHLRKISMSSLVSPALNALVSESSMISIK